MRKIFTTLLFTLTFAPFAWGQTTAVTGTATDSQATPYIAGTWTVTLKNTSSSPPIWQGSTSFRTEYGGSLDSTGSLAVTLPSNTGTGAITVGGLKTTQWQFNICARDGGTCFIAAVTISGTSQSISASLVNSSRITFTDGEPNQPPCGSNQVIVSLGSTSWGCVATSAINVPGGSNTQVQFNDAGAFNGDAGLTYNKATDTLTVGSSLVSNGQPWIDAQAGGMVCDGSTDDTTAMNAILTTLYNQGGGTLMIPAGKTCRINGQITLPNDGASPYPFQPPVRITSFGNTTFSAGSIPPFGTPVGGATLDLRFNSATAKIDSRGAGQFEIDHITLRDNGSDCAAFVFVTNTVLHIHDTGFYGTALTTLACNDGVILGGTGATSTGTAAGDFTGFGTTIRENFFAGVRRAVLGQSGVNGVEIVDNMVAASSGGPANGAIEFSPPAQGAFGNYIAGNLLEIPYYKYGIWFNCSQQCNGNMMVGNDLWDANATYNVAGYRFESTATYNTVISAYDSGIIPFSDASGTNNYYGVQSTNPASVQSGTWKFTNAGTPIQLSGNPAPANNYDIFNGATNDEFFQQVSNSANNVNWFLTLKPQGGANANMLNVTHLSTGIQTDVQIGSSADTLDRITANTSGSGADLRLMSGGSAKVVWLCGGAGVCTTFVDSTGRVRGTPGIDYAEGTPANGASGLARFSTNSTDHTVHFNANNNGDLSPSGAWSCTNVTPVTVSANVSTDQNLMACTIPAGTLNRVGRTLRIFAAGVYSTPAASVAQMTFQVKLCTVSGCGSGTVISPINIQTTALGAIAVTGENWKIDSRTTTQTAGASSAYESHGDLTIDLTNLTTGADSIFGDTNTATVGTIDSTAAIFLQITGAFSTASASNSFTQRQLIIETVN